MTIVLIAFIFIIIISVLYNVIQFSRTESVYVIRVNWIKFNDNRYKKYTYAEMLDPNIKNWYGLKTVKEEDFK